MLGWKEFWRDLGHVEGVWAYRTWQATEEQALDPSWGKASVWYGHCNIFSPGEWGVRQEFPLFLGQRAILNFCPLVVVSKLTS